MKNIVDRLKVLSFGHAISDVAEDLGIDIGITSHVTIDIIDILPSVENISVTQFRLAIVTAIVRSFDPEKKDIGKVPYLRAMYEKFCDTGLLTAADMQSYHTMMFILHPRQEDKQCPQCPVKKQQPPANIDDRQNLQERRKVIDKIIINSVSSESINLHSIVNDHPEFTFDDIQARAWYLVASGEIELDNNWNLTKISA